MSAKNVLDDVHEMLSKVSDCRIDITPLIQSSSGIEFSRYMIVTWPDGKRKYAYVPHNLPDQLEHDFGGTFLMLLTVFSEIYTRV